ncbi:MAG: HdeD family acid-resistance protein [Thermodesulfobacteriota bacterium]
MLHLLSRNWWAVLLRGICAVLFGLAAFAWPGITLGVLILFYGAYVLVEGIFAVVSSFGRTKDSKFPWSMFLVGFVSIAVGVITFVWPGLTALALLYLIGAWAI